MDVTGTPSTIRPFFGDDQTPKASDVEVYILDDDGNQRLLNSDEVEEMIPSFVDGEFQSQEMKRLVAMHEPEESIPVGLSQIDYNSSDIFPDWILQNSIWKNAPKKVESNEISEILSVPVSKRTPEQNSTLIHWLMSVWQIANTMGFKRCGAMIKEFNYNVVQANETIVTEGERGLTFYIIISGTATVLKEGLGVVGQLGKGKSFGEIALTQGKDLRTATVIAQTKMEVLSLHKQNYDIFVRDIQEIERRENFQLLANCTLFKSWPKGKIEKMCNTCLRKTYEAGGYIFRQGDPPDDLLIIVEGSVNIFKELVIITKNRWPVGINEWKERVRRVTKPIMLKTLQRGEYFGEIAILKNQPRSSSAIAQIRCVLLSIDKTEFLYLLNLSSLPTTKSLSDEQAILTQNLAKYYDDQQVMETVQHIKGGPQSVAYVGQVKVEKAALDQKVLREFAKDADDLDDTKPSTAPAGVTAESDPFPMPGAEGNAGDNGGAGSPGRRGNSAPGRGNRIKRAGSASPTRPRSSGGNNNNGVTPGDGMDPVFLRITRRASVAEQIRNAVIEAKSKKAEQLASRNMDYSRAFLKGNHLDRWNGGGHRPQQQPGQTPSAEDLIHYQQLQNTPHFSGAGSPTHGGRAGSPAGHRQAAGGTQQPTISRAKLRVQTQSLLRDKLARHQDTQQRRPSIAFAGDHVQHLTNHRKRQEVFSMTADSPLVDSQQPQTVPVQAQGQLGPIAAAAAAAAAAVGISWTAHGLGNHQEDDDSFFQYHNHQQQQHNHHEGETDRLVAHSSSAQSLRPPPLHVNRDGAARPHRHSSPLPASKMKSPANLHTGTLSSGTATTSSPGAAHHQHPHHHAHNNHHHPSPASHRRMSLQGLDNDAFTTYPFDPNRVVLRRNSAIRLGQVYEHVYQRIQHETAQESAASAAAIQRHAIPTLPRRSSYDFLSNEQQQLMQHQHNHHGSSAARHGPGFSRRTSQARLTHTPNRANLHHQAQQLQHARITHQLQHPPPGVQNSSSRHHNPLAMHAEDSQESEQHSNPVVYHLRHLHQDGLSNSASYDSHDNDVVAAHVPFSKPQPQAASHNKMNTTSSSGAALNTSSSAVKVGGGVIQAPKRRGSTGIFQPYHEAAGAILESVTLPVLAKVASVNAERLLQQWQSTPNDP